MRNPPLARSNVCLLGLENIPVLLPEYSHHRVGGEQVQQSLLAKSLARRGYSVTMVSMDYGQADRIEREGITVFKSYAADAGIPVIRFLHPRWTGLWSALSRANAEVYYTSCASAQVGILALFCLLNNRKFIFRIASDSDCDPARLLIRFARDKWLYEFGIRRANAILAQSSTQVEAMERNYGLHASVASMFVEMPSKELSFSERDIDVLWVSNIRKVKRPDLALDLATSMPAVSFHMAGGALEPELYRQTERRGQTISNLTFHGQIAYKDVGNLYDRCRIFLNTSDVEGFPNSYLQAWVRGVPVVAFFDPDDVIRSEGLGYALRGIDEMRAAIESLLQSSESHAMCASRCIQFMSTHYPEEVIIAPYLQAIDGLLNSA